MLRSTLAPQTYIPDTPSPAKAELYVELNMSIEKTKFFPVAFAIDVAVTENLNQPSPTEATVVVEPHNVAYNVPEDALNWPPVPLPHWLNAVLPNFTCTLA
jgi:hypothetical protein